MLDDAAIRRHLIAFLENKKPPPSLIIEELRVHNGNAIADVAALYRSLHGFEIKGESDNVSRVTKQSVFYNLSFPKMTLVTTENHLGWATRNLPAFWGIILVKDDESGVSLQYKRRARNNPNFSKQTSLLMLWKAELLENNIKCDQLSIRKNDSRAVIAEKMAAVMTKNEILSLLGNSITNRQRGQSKVVDNEGDVRV